MDHPRNPELEALVMAKPFDRDAHLVYADWLQSIGDPQGELIAVSIAAEDEPKRARKLKMRAKKLLQAFVETRCVPAFPVLEHRFRAWEDERAYQPDKMFGSSVQRIDWRWGLIRSIGMNSWPPNILKEGLALATSPLAMFVEEVDLWSSSVDDLTPLASLQCLRRLNLAKAKDVVDLSPLASLWKLRWFSAGRTSIADLTPLAGLRELRYVGVEGTKVANLEPLHDLPYLWLVEAGGTKVTVEQAEALRAKLSLHVDVPEEVTLAAYKRPCVHGPVPGGG